MKVDSNMETDRLLQRYAQRRRDVSTSDAETDRAFRETNAYDNQLDTSHLDADELIAYAENALPAASRTRYTTHLSDCDSCRKLVTDLALASGAAAKLDTQAVPLVTATTRSWREWLAAIFAPRVLRYAASIIVLIGITAIALVVFRKGETPRFNTGEEPGAERSDTKSSDGSASKNNGTSQDTNSNVQTEASPNGEVSKSETASATPSSAPADVPRDAPQEARKAGQTQPSANPAAPPSLSNDGLYGEDSETREKDADLAQRRQPVFGASASDKNKPKKDSVDGVATGKLGESAGRDMADDTVSTEVAKAAPSKAAAAREGKSAASRRARSNAESAPSGGAPATATDERSSRVDNGRAEGTRTVGGKQFVRRDGVWVDVAYRSQATTNVKRGSDQYRGLVADEPELRTFATQLGGDVIVVWRGRAYRIY